MSEAVDKLYTKYGIDIAPKRREPIAFKDKRFDSKASFNEFLLNDDYKLETEKNNLVYISQIDSKKILIRIFKKSEDSYSQVGYIDSIYNKRFKNLYISIINIRDDYRSCGCGTEIYNIFEEKAKQLFDVKTISGKLNFWRDYEKREAFFKKLGFKVFSEDECGFNNEILKEIKIK